MRKQSPEYLAFLLALKPGDPVTLKSYGNCRREYVRHVVSRVTPTRVKVRIHSQHEMEFNRTGRDAGEQYGCKGEPWRSTWTELSPCDSVEEREHRLRVEVEGLIAKVKTHLGRIGLKADRLPEVKAAVESVEATIAPFVEPESGSRST